ncbi:hypothetical protein [Rhodopirellula sp. MGV]|uniref:hypothetical protein n=1 Tax=Rhodopirellula sp. MGV TaxID=2023130 RepID=UPI000B96E023|nr:hypothetical protein [Rhodopirellula sp. MGV]OYP30319.1 hypothetical protein CGZ80_22780 [Rhodopirellula sp. MGV]PNY34675.1 hypothetical protein C2E31_22125 [Rhodopirellula baltica]
MDQFDQIPADQILAFSAVAIAVGVAVAFAVISMLAITLKFCFSNFAPRTPSFMGCLGLVIGMCLVNLTFPSLLGSIIGSPGYLIGLPLVWISNAYLISSSGECSMWRGVGIMIAHNIVNGLAMLLLLMVILLPIFVLGSESFQDLFPTNTNQASTETELPIAQNVFDIEDATTVGFSNDMPEAISQTQPTSVPAKPIAVPVQPTQPRKHAADGTTINPFFQ